MTKPTIILDQELSIPLLTPFDLGAPFPSLPGEHEERAAGKDRLRPVRIPSEDSPLLRGKPAR